MSRPLYESNLRRLTAELTTYAEQYGVVNEESRQRDAEHISQRMLLSHSTAESNFAAICKSNRLLSPRKVSQLRGTVFDLNGIEARLGTGNAVFLYAAPFRFPHTGCGFLFSATLESAHRNDGVAASFDSGGLLKVFTRSDAAESAVDFLRRHELPIPDHREYLARNLSCLFNHPNEYLNGVPPSLASPIGLSGGDSRRWTHETRIPDQVFLRTEHLQAVFVARSRLADGDVEGMARWCETEGVDFIHFNTPKGNDFEVLQRECVQYMIKNLI